ncbi:signal peptidase II [Spiroplasma endosymbiont of Dioctria linearis]|uniref:signal peptidase II n=1 Tax=Spiroplasma endosymbiont of Dioctria linearis TaxID=3066290 RepID=UPI00313C3F9C
MKDFLFNIKSGLKSHNYIFKFKLIWCIPLIAVLIGFDWISKAIVVNTMKYEGNDATFIPGFISFNYIINPGAAYGMNADNKGLAITIATLVTLLLITVFIFLKNKYWLIPINLMVAGSVANLLGRAWAPISKDGISGGVVDFLKFEFWNSNFIFNLADAWVSIAVAIIFIIFIVYIVIEISEFNMKKKSLEKYEFYCDIKHRKMLLFESYWSKIITKNQEKFSYKDYLSKNKQLEKEWKEYKNKE